MNEADIAEADLLVCRCEGCCTESTNGKGRLWYVPLDMSKAYPIRDLEVYA